jgi:hypothetical protein
MDENWALVEAVITVPLMASHTAHVDLTRAQAALEDLDWLRSDRSGRAVGPALRRVSSYLDLPIMDGSATGPIRKAAIIEIGPPRVASDAILAEVSWRSATFAPLFPVFAGRLRVAEIGLFLDGRYVPPFGQLGLVIDENLLRFVARRTAQAFLARLAAHIAD